MSISLRTAGAATEVLAVPEDSPAKVPVTRPDTEKAPNRSGRGQRKSPGRKPPKLRVPPPRHEASVSPPPPRRRHRARSPGESSWPPGEAIIVPSGPLVVGAPNEAAASPSPPSASDAPATPASLPAPSGQRAFLAALSPAEYKALGAALNRQSLFLEERFFPVALIDAFSLQGKITASGMHVYLGRICQEAGALEDPIEKMLVEQMILAHQKIGEMWGLAARTSDLEFKRLYIHAAVRLTGGVSTLATALASYRSKGRPRRPKHVQTRKENRTPTESDPEAVDDP